MEVKKLKLCAILGVSNVTVMKWQEMGMPYTPGGRGTGNANVYETAAVIEWLKKRAVADAGLGGGIDDEKERLTKEQADAAALKNAQTRGELIDLAGAMGVAQRCAAVIRQKILASSMPEREKQALLADIHGLAETDFANAGADDDEKYEGADDDPAQKA